MDKIEVALGARSYDILIGSGLLEQAGAQIAARSGARKAAILTDDQVGPLYANKLIESLTAAGLSSIVHSVPAGEASKSFAVYAQVCETFLEAGLERSDLIIALGGGVIGDLAGFVAATLKRGCGFVQIPTTLLAQVDSSVGGKTAINSVHGKNLIGSFYQPQLVLIDIDVLASLPERQIKAGYAEIIKYGWLGDSEFTTWLEDNGADVLALAPDALTFAIAQSCRAKAAIVSEDEREGGRRALLNFGHTFAHALEARAAYDGSLLHGEAVAAGMLMAFDYSVYRGLCPAEDAARARAHSAALNLPRFECLPPALTENPAELTVPMRQDKKNEGGKLTLILTNGMGRAFISKGEDEAPLREFLSGYLGDLRSQ